MAEDFPSPSGLLRASLETTPLLLDEPNENGQNNSSSLAPSPKASPRAPRRIPILTVLSLCLSITSLALDISTNIITAYPPPGFYLTSGFEFFLRVVLILTILSTILSALNCVWLRLHLRALPTWLNLIPDAVICFYGIALSGPLRVALFDEYGDPCSPGWNDDFDTSTCDAFLKRLKVLVGITFGFVLALGIVHAIAFVIRCVYIYKTKFWQEWRRLPFRCGPGEFTIELSFKLRRQEDTDRLD